MSQARKESLDIQVLVTLCDKVEGVGGHEGFKIFTASLERNHIFWIEIEIPEGAVPNLGVGCCMAHGHQSVTEKPPLIEDAMVIMKILSEIRQIHALHILFRLVYLLVVCLVK